MPDILDTRELPLRQYGARGVLEDLWPFIDNDPDLGRDALMVRPLEANCQDGKLYEIFNSFSIRTTAGSGRIVGDRTGWTLADLQEALAKMPEGCSIFGQSDTRDDMLSTVVALNMDRFVDWDTGKCSFDSQDFKDLLSFCGSFPAEFSWENVDWETWEEEDIRAMNGKQLLLEMYLSGFDWDIQRLAAIFNDDFSFIGYPREDGGWGSSFSRAMKNSMVSSPSTSPTSTRWWTRRSSPGMRRTRTGIPCWATTASLSPSIRVPSGSATARRSPPAPSVRRTWTR